MQMNRLTLTNIPDDVLRAKQRLGIIGNAPALIEAISRAIRVAPIDLSVLVTGESGTGKEFFPQIIHNYSPRKHCKYIAVNCGAIPEGTIDSELFGHEKGAFTGAIAARKGYFEEADGGTVFLDEVAELPMTTQARLLRVLETGEYIRVGSSEVRKTNIRIVAATNVDMAKAVADGRFREDLYYRLSTVQIAIPPLRRRGSDILLLARKFASDFASRYRMPPVEFDDSAKASLERYMWPGNVRQLKNVVEQIALFDSGRSINATEVASYLPEVNTVLTPVKGVDGGGAYAREREMLFNMIFRMQREIDRLKAIVESEDTSQHEVEQVTGNVIVDTNGRETDEVSRALICADHLKTPDHNFFIETTEPTVVTEPVSRTLVETERDTIADALRRNSGRRKATAEELNISERTLYRKIKEYGLE